MFDDPSKSWPPKRVSENSYPCKANVKEKKSVYDQVSSTWIIQKNCSLIMTSLSTSRETRRIVFLHWLITRWNQNFFQRSDSNAIKFTHCADFSSPLSDSSCFTRYRATSIEADKPKALSAICSCDWQLSYAWIECWLSGSSCTASLSREWSTTQCFPPTFFQFLAPIVTKCFFAWVYFKNRKKQSSNHCDSCSRVMDGLWIS